MNAPVTLVIPGKNASRTLRTCLESVVPLLNEGQLEEIIFVDDGSSDDSAEIADRFPVRRISQPWAGPAAARNTGWRAATTPLVWFIDSDCCAEIYSLELLLDRFEDSDFAAVGGSYSNLCSYSLLASLIHEEIVSRHRWMPAEVDFLGTFNVLYCRETLEKVGGFDERFMWSEDVELAYRFRATGAKLGFVAESRVGHHHADRPWAYFSRQAAHGYWRAYLYLTYPGKMGGDSYSTLADHLQPPLAMLSLGLVPVALWTGTATPVVLAVATLAWLTLPMTWRMVREGRNLKLAWFAPLSFLRAYARGIGLSLGTIRALAERIRFLRSASARR